MAKSLSEILRGPIEIKADGVAIAYTGDDTKLTIKRDLEGDGPDELSAEAVYFSGRQGIVIETTLKQFSKTLLNMLVPESVLSGDVFYFGRTPGQEVAEANNFLTTLHPIRSATSLDDDVTLWKAFFAADPLEVEFAAKKNRDLKVKIIAIPDTTKDDGKQLGAIGDVSDTAAPTLSSSTPADAAESVAARSTVVLVFSKSMSRLSLLDRAGTNIPMGISVVNSTDLSLVHVTAAFSTTTVADDTITLTAAANFTPEKIIAAVLTKGVRSKGGGQFAGDVVNFTMAAA